MSSCASRILEGAAQHLGARRKVRAAQAVHRPARRASAAVRTRLSARGGDRATTFFSAVSTAKRSVAGSQAACDIEGRVCNVILLS